MARERALGLTLCDFFFWCEILSFSKRTEEELDTGEGDLELYASDILWGNDDTLSGARRLLEGSARS